MMTLKLLDETARSRLRSGVAIRSMAHCVAELVENSIDAGATCVAVRVDTTKFKIQVVDNGKGISREDLNLLGDRYMTSKCHTVDDLEHNLHYLGYRGEALASVVNVSGIVEICSRHCLSRDTCSRMFHNGKPMNVMLSKTHRPSVGTTITVHEFFYNMPVRRKVLSADLELEQVKKAVECIALVNPSRSFSVRNDITGECILKTRKTYSVLTNFGLIFGGDKVANMKEVNHTHENFELTGFMSTVGHYNKLLQFIYVNGHIVKKTPLHSTVNSLLANSLLSRKLSRQPRDQSSHDQLISPKRAVETHGVYVLLLKCSRSEYDVCLEPAKTLIEFQRWPDVLLTFETLVRQFLTKHHLTLGPGVTNDSEETEADPQCGSTVKAVQPSRVHHHHTESSLTGSRNEESLAVPSLEMQSSLQSKVVRRPKKLHQRQTSTDLTATEEPSTMVEDTTAVVNVHQTVIDNDDNVTTSFSQSADLPPGMSLCVSLARCQPVASRDDDSNNSTSTSLEDPQQASVTAISQASSTPMSDSTKPLCHPHISQSTTLGSLSHDTLPKPSSNVLARHLNCNHSTLKQTPNSLFLTSFYPRASSSTPQEQVTVAQTQSIHHASNFQNESDDFHGSSTIAAQPSLQAFSHHPTQLLSATAQPRKDGPQKGAPAAKKIALGLNVLVRSPLQSSPGATRLARLFKHKARKGAGTVSAVATQQSNLSQRLRHNGMNKQDLPKTSELPVSNSSTETDYHLTESNSNIDTCSPEPSLGVSMIMGSTSTVSIQPCVTTVCGLESMSAEVENNVELSSGPLVLSDNGLSPRLKALIQPMEGGSSHQTDSSELFLITGPHPLPPSSSPVTSPPLPDSHHQFHPTEEACTSEAHNLTDVCFSSTATLSSLGQCEVGCEPHASCLPCTLEEESEPIDGHSISHQEPLQASINVSIGDSTLTHISESGTTHKVFVDKGDTSRPLWKESIDPVTRKTVWIHSKTGDVLTSKPTKHSSIPLPPPALPTHYDPLSTANPEDSGLGDSLTLDSSSISTSSSYHTTHSDPPALTAASFGARPLRAAPHLSHDFENFLPRPKHLRTSFASSENNLDATLESVLSDPSGDVVGSNKWRNSEEVDELHRTEGTASNISLATLLEQWENPTFQPGDVDVLDVAHDGRQRGQVRVHQVINRYKFTKEMFNNVKVLGQVDNKFIACLLDSKNNGAHDLLVMIDQHAAHERVRLEDLLNNLYESREETSQLLRIKSSKIQPPLPISLQPTEIRLAKLFRQQLQATGVSLVFDRGHVYVSSLPSVLMEREASEVRRGRPAVAASLLQEMIVKHLELLQTTSGGSSMIPAALIHVLNSQACHGAIKFGDPLTFGECESLIQSLSQCNLPFQCAHGRPSLIPILDLDILNQRYPVSQIPSLPNFKKLTKSLKF